MSPVMNRRQPLLLDIEILLRDIEILRQHALPEEVSLGVDDLACAIIRREIDKRQRQSRG